MFEEDLKVYRIFISHIKHDDEEYDLFLSKLDAAYDFKWKDTAVWEGTSPDDLRKQMEQAGVVIILSGLISKDKQLLTSMIDTATKLKKQIVVVRPYGMEAVPLNLEEIATDVIGWNTPCIVDSIMEAHGDEI
ncbi:MAG TPA: hypothetical protein PLC38_01740 [Methanobacterium sp.]|jgi:hypothetical protein|nr:MAG: hypothetical protein FGO69_04805 [Methanobacterium sp.]HOI39846.1 hypothetical protein [Methanobacterium sp.]HOI70988.1 hypothetical protein [Methanobacterium sp.]